MEQNKGDHFVIQRGKRTRGMEIDTPLPGGESVMRLSFTTARGDMGDSRRQREHDPSCGSSY